MTNTVPGSRRKEAASHYRDQHYYYDTRKKKPEFTFNLARYIKDVVHLPRSERWPRNVAAELSAVPYTPVVHKDGFQIEFKRHVLTIPNSTRTSWWKILLKQHYDSAKCVRSMKDTNHTVHFTKGNLEKSHDVGDYSQGLTKSGKTSTKLWSLSLKKLARIFDSGADSTDFLERRCGHVKFKLALGDDKLGVQCDMIFDHNPAHPHQMFVIFSRNSNPKIYSYRKWQQWKATFAKYIDDDSAMDDDNYNDDDEFESSNGNSIIPFYNSSNNSDGPYGGDDDKGKNGKQNNNNNSTFSNTGTALKDIPGGTPLTAKDLLRLLDMMTSNNSQKKVANWKKQYQ
jgi:hypothetical protein